jgi:hypothetical protein
MATPSPPSINAVGIEYNPIDNLKDPFATAFSACDFFGSSVADFLLSVFIDFDHLVLYRLELLVHNPSFV